MCFWREGITIRKVDRSDKSRRALVEQVNRLAWLLDNSIEIPLINYRIGLDAIIGLIPGIGDAAGLVVSSLIVLQAVRLGVPRSVLTRMASNIAIEAIVGVIPVVGDLFDATFKANERNVRLLNEAVGNLPPERTMAQPLGAGIVAAAAGAVMGVVGLVGVGISAIFWWLVSLR